MKFKKGSIRKSLGFSLADGLFTAMMLGVSENYLIAYAIALGAKPSQVAFLASLPPLVASLLQIHSAGLTKTVGSRLKLIHVAVFFHALAWLPIILIPYLLSSGTVSRFAPWALLLAVIVFASAGAFTVTVWQSLMSDTIPVKRRGAYFGWRNRLQGFFTVAVSVAAGLILHYFGKNSLVGFTLIFSFAMFCRFLAWVCLTRMTEPFRRTSHDEYFSFADFLKGMTTRNFARFVLFVSVMSFVVNISAPMIAVFLLKDIGFSYAAYMFVVTSASLSGFLFQASWGRAGDQGGNLKVIRVLGWGIAVIPLFWLFSHHWFYLFFVQLFAGCFWGGFNLLVLNFIMEAVSPQKRIRCISYFNITNSFAVFAGAAIGGALLHRLPPLFGYSFLTLFLISCLGRMAVMALVFQIVREVRQLNGT